MTRLILARGPTAIVPLQPSSSPVNIITRSDLEASETSERLSLHNYARNTRINHVPDYYGKVSEDCTGHKGIWFEKTLYTSQALFMQNLGLLLMLACSKKLVSWFGMTLK